MIFVIDVVDTATQQLPAYRTLFETLLSNESRTDRHIRNNRSKQFQCWRAGQRSMFVIFVLFCFRIVLSWTWIGGFFFFFEKKTNNNQNKANQKLPSYGLIFLFLFFLLNVSTVCFNDVGQSSLARVWMWKMNERNFDLLYTMIIIYSIIALFFFVDERLFYVVRVVEGKSPMAGNCVC